MESFYIKVIVCDLFIWTKMRLSVLLQGLVVMSLVIQK